MKGLKPQFILLLFTFVFLSCTSDDNNSDNNNELTLDYQELLNISYGNDSRQVFDLYLPENRTLTTKVMILVHGGSWVSGDKNDMNDIKDAMRAEYPNIAIVNVNYRLAGSGISPYPMQLNDITAVIEHLETHQNNYTISNDYGFVGVSAGGHLSLLWSYAFDTNNAVEMVCSIVGPTNFTDPNYLNNPLATAALSNFGIAITDTALLEEMSPYHNVTASSPPTILFYGGMDPLVPTSQGVDLDAKLNQLSVPHEFTLYPDEGHGWSGDNLDDSYTKLNAFIATYFE
ncbi:MAG: alpha/beta hydrolase [Flavobacteriaceae bacterium]|nr:alpha/beta hydrolase [Flavobacteriaceae bacterium]